jgi:outer membrane protein TolC
MSSSPSFPLSAASGATLNRDGRLAPPRLGRTGDVDARLDQLTAGGAGLGAEYAAQMAYRSSSEGLVRREEKAVADARFDQAFQAYFPTLSAVARYTRYSNIVPPPVQSGLFVDPSIPAGPVPPGTQLFKSAPQAFPVFNDQYLAQASLTVPLSDYALRISQNVASASHSVEARRLDEKAARLQSAAEARIAYYAWLRAHAHVVIAELSLEQARSHQGEVRVGVDAGRAPRADLLAVDVEVARAGLSLAEAQHEVIRLTKELSTRMHQPIAPDVRPAEDLRRLLPPLDGGDDLERLTAQALKTRPEIQALEESSRSYLDAATVARAALWPSVQAFGDVVTASPNPRYFPQTSQVETTWDVGIQLTWVANSAALAPALAAESKAKASEAEAQRQALCEAIAKEVYDAFYGEEEAAADVGAAAQNLDAAEEQYRLSRERFENGALTSVDLTSAELDLFRARIDAVNVRANVYAARVRLLRATGRDILAFPD